MIDYIVFPVADIDEEKSAKIDELNLVPRSNVSKDKGLMKCQHYKEVFPEKVTRTVTTDEEGLEIISIEYPYETYSNEALATLLSSPEWNFKEDEVIEDSPIEDRNERFNDYGDEHFNKQEAKRTVDEMYHVKDGKKYIGEKYDMQKAHEVCSKFKDKLEDEVEVADVYVAINAQYHDYCELFEKWFGKGNFDDMIFESAISFWFDDVDFGEDKLWKYFNELK